MKRILLLIILLPVILTAANYEFALELYRDGLYEEAIMEFERVIDQSPTGEEAQLSLFYIGESYRNQSNWLEAEKSYARLIRAYPGSEAPDRNHYYLGLMQYKQGKYAESEAEFEELVDNYPQSAFSKQSLVEYLDSIYQQEKYEQVIAIGNKLWSNYEESKFAADLLLLISRANFALSRMEKGRELLNEISESYPLSDARWAMIDLQMELLEKEKGKEAVIIELGKILTDTVPRKYEKEIRQLLIDLYLETGNYEEAVNGLEIMISKYDNAEDLDKIIVEYLEALIEVKQFEKVVNSRADFDKVFRESSLKGEYELLIAWGYYHQRYYKQSLEIVEQLLNSKTQEGLESRVLYLAGKIASGRGRYREAINHWQKILKGSSENTAQILYEIALIYQNKFKNYNTALNYYQQIITNFASSGYQAQAIFNISECYRALGNTEEALRQLESVNLETVEEAGLRSRMKLTREYIREYELEDYETAFQELLGSLSSYLQHNNKALLQQNLAEILAYDLKEYKEGSELLSASSPETGYRKALILLKIANKLNRISPFSGILEDRQERDAILLQVNSIVFNLGDALPEDRQKELKIKKLREANDQNEEVFTMMESYVAEFPDGEARNEFLLELAGYYSGKDDREKLVANWEKLRLDDRIAESDYYTARINLAEYYYGQKESEKALKLYNELRDQITSSDPEVLYHYTRLSIEHGGKTSRMKNLTFLIDNEISFPSYNEALLFLINSLRESGHYERSIHYSEYVPSTLQDDEYFRKLAADYLAVNDKEAAKQNLMRIEDKDDKILLELADLQYQTGDFAMALYSYGVLQEKAGAALRTYLRSGDIYFDQGEFSSAIEQYGKYLEKSDGADEDYGQVVKNYIVSYYRINNRPRAEKLQKQYKKELTEEIEQEISLAEAIYYIENDAGKSEKLFNKLLKKDLSVEVMIKAYFWRGVLYLNNANLAKAKPDFVTVSQSKDEELATQARFKLGLINLSEENFTESLDHFYYVINHDKSGKLALDAAHNFAKICKTIEEWDKAIGAYEIILEKWGDQGLKTQTVFDIAFCYFRDKNYDKAIEMFEQVLPLLEDESLQAEAQYWIGMSYFEDDMFEKSVTELLKVSYSYNSYPRWAASAELQAGEAYMRLQKMNKARRIYERVIEKYGSGSQWGGLAKQRLDEM